MTIKSRPKSLPLASADCTPALRSSLNVEQANQYAALFKALADPTRLQIISMLFDAGDGGLCVCDIGVNFPLEQPTISHHLRVLKDAGLVHARKEGLWVFYSLDREKLASAGLLSFAGRDLDRQNG